jgi:acetyltransferase EpsM
MPQSQPLLFLGDGFFAVEALDIAEDSGGFVPLGFVNSARQPEPGATREGLPIFAVEQIPYGIDECSVICAIASTRRRAFIERVLALGYRFTSLAHPSARVSRRAHIGVGSILNAAAVVSAHAAVGEHTIVNRGALIGHDTRIGKFCSIGPGANMAGNVQIGEGAWIGIGAVIRERVKIGAGAVVAAGAVVVRDVNANELVAGVPARVVRSDVQGL